MTDEEELRCPTAPSPCVIEGCPNPGTVHVSGFPDCVDLCPTCDFICRDRSDAFSESMREQGCEHPVYDQEATR